VPGMDCWTRVMMSFGEMEEEEENGRWRGQLGFIRTGRDEQLGDASRKQFCYTAVTLNRMRQAWVAHRRRARWF
jgi:hypothetical protein